MHATHGLTSSPLPSQIPGFLVYRSSESELSGFSACGAACRRTRDKSGRDWEDLKVLEA
jgi:hypothetical protein